MLCPGSFKKIAEAFVEGLDLRKIGFNSAIPKQTGRPAYRPATLLKLYIYGYMNRIQSSRRLEQETHRNVELMWLLGRLQPDFKTIANFRKDNSKAIQQCCREFVEICRKLDLFAKSIIAIDGSKFKAVNTKQKNDTQGSLKGIVALTAHKAYVFTQRKLNGYFHEIQSVQTPQIPAPNHSTRRSLVLPLPTFLP